jgi:hypothetical protein
MTCLFSKRPNYIKLEEMATESVLKAFCKALKIKLVKERRPLRDLNDAWEYLHNYTMDM